MSEEKEKEVGGEEEGVRAEAGTGESEGEDVRAGERENGGEDARAGERENGGAGSEEDSGAGSEEEIEEQVELSRSHLKGLLEALVFVAEKPISLGELVKLTGADRKLVRTLLDELADEYQHRGIRLQEIAGGYIFRTNAVYAPFLRDNAARKPVRMTRAQLETLAIIAYRQPLTRPDIDEIRGVDSGAVLKMLLERDLVRILGKKDEPGRPLLYGTTAQFLEFFGLKSLKDLPTLRELTELTEESRRILVRELGDEADVEGGEAIPNNPEAAPAAPQVEADNPPEGSGS